MSFDWDWQAQQEVPSWLEESAFSSGPGTMGVNPARKHFASSDSRKVKGITVVLLFITVIILQLTILCVSLMFIHREALSKTMV